MKASQWVWVAALAGTALFAAAPPAARGASAAFDDALMAAMTRMDAATASVPMTGNADRDFVAMMLPHHRAAVDMATIELAHGHDPRLRRLAQEIVVTQQSEITVMHAIGRDLSPTALSKESR
ncbi:MAG: hypothetical protein NVSMB5_00080 [Candidatus Velthaea sp.]